MPIIEGATRFYPRIQRHTNEFRSLYRRRAAVEREFGRLKHDYGLAPLRVRGLARVQPRADLVMLARLTLAQAIPIGAQIYSRGMGCLVAFLGAAVGTAVGIALTFPLLAGTEADAFSYLATFIFLGFIGGALGATFALVWRDFRKRRRNSAKPSY
jgi:hypothetical protein